MSSNSSSSGGRTKFGPARWAALIVGVSLAVSLIWVPRVASAQLGTAGGEALIGPIVAVTLALVTRRLLLSLLLGVLAAGITLASHRGVITTGEYLASELFDSFKIYIALFTAALLGMAGLMGASGGTAGLVHSARRWVTSKRSSKLATFGLGLLVFFDDYANCMLVGPTMRPMCDEHRVSRAKLAYIVDSTAAPVAGLALLSTWVGYEIGLASDAAGKVGMPLDGIALLVAALPFRFYCVFALALVAITSLMNRDFGPMLRAERDREQGGGPHPVNPGDERDESRPSYDAPASGVPPKARNAIIPLAVVTLATIFGLFFDGLISLGGEGLAPWYTAAFWDQIASAGAAQGPLHSAGFWRETLSASENNTLVLFVAAAAGAVVAFALPVFQRALSPARALGAFFSGMKHAAMPLAILVMAWALSAACKDLGTGPVMASMLGDRLDPSLLPLVTFFCGAVIAFATGSSWTAMGILIPVAVPVAFQMGGEAITLIALAAVLDGAIFGDHCSPISDTTIMSSIGADCNLLEHVVTQAPYAITAMLVAAFAGYLPAGAGVSPFLSIGAGIAALAILTFVLGRRTGSNSHAAKSEAAERARATN